MNTRRHHSINDLASVALDTHGCACVGRHRDPKGFVMARRCELTGKAVLTGNNVSHANNKTRRRFLPNLVSVSLLSDALQEKVRVRIAASSLRSVEHRGGLDAFLMKAKADSLSPRMRLLKRRVEDKLAAAPAA